MADDDAVEVDFVITRRPKLQVLLGGGIDTTWEEIHGKKLFCVMCGGETWLVGHHNLIVDREAGTARIDGTEHLGCYHCRANVPGMKAYGPDANVTSRDWSNLSLAAALVRTIRSEARHG